MQLNLGGLFEVTDALTSEASLANPPKTFVNEWLLSRFPTLMGKWRTTVDDGRICAIVDLTPLNRLNGVTSCTVLVKQLLCNTSTCDECGLVHSISWENLNFCAPTSGPTDGTQSGQVCVAGITKLLLSRITSRLRQKMINAFVQQCMNFEISMQVADGLLTNLPIDNRTEVSLRRYIHFEGMIKEFALNGAGQRLYEKQYFNSREFASAFASNPVHFMTVLCAEVARLNIGIRTPVESILPKDLASKRVSKKRQYEQYDFDIMMKLPSAKELRSALGFTPVDEDSDGVFSLPWDRCPTIFRSEYPGLLKIFKSDLLTKTDVSVYAIGSLIDPIMFKQTRDGIVKPKWLRRIEAEHCVLLSLLAFSYYVQLPLSMNVESSSTCVPRIIDLTQSIGMLLSVSTPVLPLRALPFASASRIDNFLPLRIADSGPHLFSQAYCTNPGSGTSGWYYFAGASDDDASLYTSGCCQACASKQDSSASYISVLLRAGVWLMRNELNRERNLHGAYAIVGCMTCEREAVVPLGGSLASILSADDIASLVRTPDLAVHSEYAARLCDIARQIVIQPKPKRKVALNFSQIVYVLSSSNSSMTINKKTLGEDGQRSRNAQRTTAREMERIISFEFKSNGYNDYARGMTVRLRPGTFPFCNTCDRIQLSWVEMGKKVVPNIHCEGCRTSPSRNIIMAFLQEKYVRRDVTWGSYPFLKLPNSDLGTLNGYRKIISDDSSSVTFFPAGSISTVSNTTTNELADVFDNLMFYINAGVYVSDPDVLKRSLTSWSLLSSAHESSMARAVRFGRLISSFGPCLVKPEQITDSSEPDESSACFLEFNLASQVASNDFGCLVQTMGSTIVDQTAKLSLGFPFGVPCHCTSPRATWGMELRRLHEVVLTSHDLNSLTLQQGRQILNSVQRNYACSLCGVQFWPGPSKRTPVEFENWRRASLDCLNRWVGMSTQLSDPTSSLFANSCALLDVCVRGGLVSGFTVSTLVHLKALTNVQQWTLANWIFMVFVELSTRSVGIEMEQFLGRDTQAEDALLFSEATGDPPVLPTKWSLGSQRRATKREIPDSLRNSEVAKRPRQYKRGGRYRHDTENKNTTSMTSSSALVPMSAPLGTNPFYPCVGAGALVPYFDAYQDSSQLAVNSQSMNGPFTQTGMAMAMLIQMQQQIMYGSLHFPLGGSAVPETQCFGSGDARCVEHSVDVKDCASNEQLTREMCEFGTNQSVSRIFIDCPDSSANDWTLYSPTFPVHCVFSKGSLRQNSIGMPNLTQTESTREESYCDVSWTYPRVCLSNRYGYTPTVTRRACVSLWSDWLVQTTGFHETSICEAVVPFLICQIVTMGALFCQQPFRNVRWEVPDSGVDNVDCVLGPRVWVDMLQVQCKCQEQTGRSTWEFALHMLHKWNGCNPESGRGEQLRAYHSKRQQPSKPTSRVYRTPDNTNERFLCISCAACGDDWVTLQQTGKLERKLCKSTSHGSYSLPPFWPPFAQSQQKKVRLPEFWLYRGFLSKMAVHVKCPDWLGFVARLCRNRTIWKVGNWRSTITIPEELTGAMDLFCTSILDNHAFQKIVSFDEDVIHYICQHLRSSLDAAGQPTTSMYQEWQNFLTGVVDSIADPSHFVHLQIGQKQCLHKELSNRELMEIQTDIEVLLVSRGGFPSQVHAT
jgi:hypothetical protein